MYQNSHSMNLQDHLTTILLFVSGHEYSNGHNSTKIIFFCGAISTHKLNLPFSVPEEMISKEKDSAITYDLH